MLEAEFWEDLLAIMGIEKMMSFLWQRTLCGIRRLCAIYHHVLRGTVAAMKLKN